MGSEHSNLDSPQVTLDLHAHLRGPVESHDRKRIRQVTQAVDVSHRLAKVRRRYDEVSLRKESIANQIIRIHQRVTCHDQVEITS